MAYATAEELRTRIGTAVDDDTLLTALIAAAERNINRACNRPDGFLTGDAAARRYSGSGTAYQLIDECTSVTLVEVKDSATDSDYTEWTTADWIAFRGDPRAPEFDITPYTALMVDPTGSESVFTSGAFTTRGGFAPTHISKRGAPTVRVTATWGYADTVPPDIREACMMQAARWFKRYESAFSDALASGELGLLLYRKSLDPDIRRILVDGRYVKPVIGRR